MARGLAAATFFSHWQLFELELFQTDHLLFNHASRPRPPVARPERSAARMLSSSGRSGGSGFVREAASSRALTRGASLPLTCAGDVSPHRLAPLSLSNRSTQARAFDAFSFKRLVDPASLTNASTLGGLISLLGAALLAILFIAETLSYLTPSLRQDVALSPAATAPLRVTFNITFPRMPCHLLSLEVRPAAARLAQPSA